PGELREVTREHLNTLVFDGTQLAADSAAVSNRQTEQAVHASTQVDLSARAGVRTLEDRVAVRVTQGRQLGPNARTGRERGHLVVAVVVVLDHLDTRQQLGHRIRVSILRQVQFHAVRGRVHVAVVGGTNQISAQNSVLVVERRQVSGTTDRTSQLRSQVR